MEPRVAKESTGGVNRGIRSESRGAGQFGRTPVLPQVPRRLGVLFERRDPRLSAMRVHFPNSRWDPGDVPGQRPGEVLRTL